MRSDRHTAIRSVQSLLWNAALRIEEGGSSDVERELRNVQRKLRDLLSRKNIKDKELKRLMDELRQAMKRYMEALRRDMKRNPEKYARRPVDPKAKNFNPQDMKQMLDQMRRMMQNGDKKALRQMLSKLNKMMRNMRPGQPQRRVDPNHPAMRMMRQLNGLIQKQQKLMDESFRRGQKSRGNQRRDPKADKEAQKRQQALRKQLGEMMRKLGEMTGKIPKNFGNAENQMRRSQQRLGKGQPGQSVGPQGRALRELRRGAGQAMRQLARRFGLGMGKQNFARGGRGRLPRDRDPLGRKLDGMGPLDTEDVKIPNEAERKKVRDILRELRKRSGERVRPKMEREYIDRLLKRF